MTHTASLAWFAHHEFRLAWREWIAMLDRNKALGTAASAELVDEGALALIAFPNLACDLDGHVPRAGRERAAFTWLAGAFFSLGLLLDQRLQRSSKNFGQVAIGNGMAQKLARALDVFEQLRTRSELHQRARCRERFEPGSTCPGTGRWLRLS